MIESFSAYLLLNYPMFTMFGIIAAMLVYMTYTFTNKFNGIDHRFNSIEYRLSNLEDNTKDLPLMRLAMVNIEAYLKTKDKHFKSHFLRSNSPTVVSDSGLMLLKDCGGIDYINTNYDVLKKEAIEDRNIISNYDIDNNVFDLLKKRSEEKEFGAGFKMIKDFIYENPKYDDEWITFDSVIQIMSVYFRQLYLGKLE